MPAPAVSDTRPRPTAQAKLQAGGTAGNCQATDSDLLFALDAACQEAGVNFWATLAGDPALGVTTVGLTYSADGGGSYDFGQDSSLGRVCHSDTPYYSTSDHP